MCPSPYPPPRAFGAWRGRKKVNDIHTGLTPCAVLCRPSRARLRNAMSQYIGLTPYPRLCRPSRAIPPALGPDVLMTLRSSVLPPIGYSVLMALGLGVLKALEQGVLMTLRSGVLMKQESGVLPPIEYPVLPLHRVMNRYELL